MLCYAKSLQSCLTLCDPIDGSPPGFPIPGILQARTLEWVAISFSKSWGYCQAKGKVRLVCLVIGWSCVCVNVHMCVGASHLSSKALRSAHSFSSTCFSVIKCVVYYRHVKPWLMGLTRIDISLLVKVKLTSLRYLRKIYANYHCLFYRKDKTEILVLWHWIPTDNLWK